MQTERLRSVVVTGFFAVIAACQHQPAPAWALAPDAQATHTLPVQAERPLVEGESCERTLDCPINAHCIDHHCLPNQRSLRGEVLVERGARSLALGRFDEAVTIYQRAESAYSDQHMSVPSAVSCGLASSLVALIDRGSAAQDLRESAARAAQRCLRNSPVGSPSSEGTLSHLASLVDRGLDVAALDREGQTRLMTGPDRRPTAETMTLTAAFSGAADTGSRGAFKTLVEGDEIRAEFRRCFLQWHEQHRVERDEGAIRVSYSRVMDEYDMLSAPRLQLSTPEVDSTSTSTDDRQGPEHWLACSASAIRRAASDLRWPSRAERWAETITLQVATH
ncbi:MAG: hypothetical protein Q8Q09_10090 [Deltaproteobacteria bacterium]|nr:hypothetical protein [Deltaproteobacteria bacterium]